ncbi:MAG: CinA family protein [Candidatus Omnitrophica bacterium]|nr:CinA family protein [Candidatus Omnitrophota bacterium]
MKRIPLEEKVARLFKKKKKTLCFAESCTGGLISHLVTNVSGSSGYFPGGIIAYSNSVKVSTLGVPGKTIKEHGAVSREVAVQMAKGARDVLNSDAAVSITGIAGPSGGSTRKPVGLAYMAFVSKGKCRTKKVLFKGDRSSIKEKFARSALEFVIENE